MMNTKERIEQIIHEPKFNDELERKYAMMFARDCEAHNSTIWHYAHLFYWPLTLLVGYLCGFHARVLTFLGALSVVLVISSLVTLATAKTFNALRYSQLALYFACVFTCFIAARLDVLHGEGHISLAIMWIAGSAFGIGFLAFRSYVHFFAVATNLLLFGIGFQGFHQPLLGLTCGGILVIVASCIQVIGHRFFKLDAIQSFRLQSQFTPRHILMSAIESNTTVTSMFKPIDRAGAYICADWRGFQNWTASSTAENVSRTLEYFYEEQVRGLLSHFPLGNFFIDWIADEVFVAVFTCEGCTPEQVVKGSISFSKELLQKRQSFYAKHGAPIGIDVGITYGSSIMGILGPRDCQKATALGLVPGEARRLQQLGKDLRSSSGWKDRVVVAPNILEIVDLTRMGFSEVKPPLGVKVKDLNIDSMFVYEVENTSQSLDSVA